MYKFEFGQIEKRTAYIFEVDEQGRYAANIDAPNAINWKNLIGSKDAVSLKIDEEGGKEYFPGQVVKQSVSFSFYREKNDLSALNDLLGGEDNDWRCVILSGDEVMTYDGNSTIGYYPKPTNNNTGDVLFYGWLTNETYREAYLPTATINITFHDRLGELKDVDFTHNGQYITITELLATVLQGLPLNKYLNFEFPYTLNGTPIAPDTMLLDIAQFIGKKRIDVLKQFLKDFGLNLFINYTYTSESGAEIIIAESIQRCGIVTIRHLGLFQETEHNYYLYELESNVYDYKSMVTRYSVPKFIPEDFLILNRTGNIEFIRKAKYVDAKSAYEFKDNVIYPYPLTIDNLEPVDKLLNYPTFFAEDYNYITPNWATSPIITSWLKNNLEVKTAVGAVGNSQKLGVKVADRFSFSVKPFIMSRPSLMIKGDAKFGLTIEAFTIKQLDVRYCLFAYSPETDDFRVWHKPSSVASWYSYVQGDPLTPINLLNDITPNEYFSVTNDYNIPQPGAFADGQSYYISMYITYDDFAAGDFGLFITDFKLSLETAVALPPSLTLRTNISDTRRSPIEEVFKFINLPLIGNDQSFFYNGVYIRNAITEAITAPETLIYNDNDATLLVHQSELIGGQMTDTRWSFKGRILEPEAGESETIITAKWESYTCEKDAGDNNGYQRGVTYNVIQITGGQVTSNNDYSILNAIPDTAFALITEGQFAALSNTDYNDRLTAFRAYVSTQETVVDIAAFETNSNRIINESACPIPVEITLNISAEWVDVNQTATDGMGGYFTVNEGVTVLKQTDITIYDKAALDAYTGIVDTGFYVDFAQISAWVNGLQVVAYTRYSIDGGLTWSNANTTGSYKENTSILIQVQSTIFEE